MTYLVYFLHLPFFYPFYGIVPGIVPGVFNIFKTPIYLRPQKFGVKLLSRRIFFPKSCDFLALKKAVYRLKIPGTFEKN